jgi:acyl-CoA reductase-like NAD-dependent aldehyde dehydrogenase
MGLAHRIGVGQVAVNGGVMGVETPIGGYEMSGVGCEKGISALYEYTRLKTVGVTLPEPRPPEPEYQDQCQCRVENCPA